MRTPFKTLTVGLVLATAAMAGCSSTTGSSGAVQNAATAPASSSASAAASSAASTAPAPSPDPVTPTVAPTEGPASPVASPTDSPSPSGSSSAPAPVLLGASGPGNNDVCAKYMLYFCGGIGASGVGTVFYASTTPFACGANMESSCNYLEVAPQKWNGELVRCPGGCVGSPESTSDWGSAGAGSGRGYSYCQKKNTQAFDFILHATGTVVGSGFANTSTLVTYCGQDDDAGRQVRRYTGGGMTDWSLPSQDELNALYYYTNRKAIGGFAAARYWSSSLDLIFVVEARFEDFNSGKQGRNSVNDSYGIRPVRAF